MAVVDDYTTTTTNGRSCMHSANCRRCRHRRPSPPGDKEHTETMRMHMMKHLRQRTTTICYPRQFLGDWDHHDIVTAVTY